MEKGKTKKTRMELETILSEHLLNEILIHLPLKSLGQCKCLSSHWKARISHRYLAKTRLERHPKPNSTLLLNDSVIILPWHNGDVESICRTTPRNLSRCSHKSRAVGTHHGLMCLCCLHKSRAVGTHHGLICFSNYKTGDAWVCNPVMNQGRMFDFQRRDYNPLNTFFGFGFDSVNDDYKVVKISSQSEFNLRIEICQLRNTEIRVIPSVQVPFMLSNASPVTVNGSSHWIAFHRENNNLQIVRFDMNHEKFVEIPFSNDMPNIYYHANVRGIKGLNLGRLALEGFDMDGKQFRLGVFKESLCLFISDSSKVEIWLMNRDNGHVVWTRMLEIPRSRRIEVVVGFTANEELIIRNANFDYFAYDPWKRRTIFPMGHYEIDILHQTLAYVESLVPVFP